MNFRMARIPALAGGVRHGLAERALTADVLDVLDVLAA